MTKDEMIAKTNEVIGDLVYDKTELQKAYNYYNGKRDAEQFRYLEENFGIGSPTSVKFTPLLRKHIDALVGEYLGIPIVPKISCKDKSTVSNILRDKQLYIKKEVLKVMQQHLQNFLLKEIYGKETQDVNLQEQIDNLKTNLNQNFVSEYEIAAQNVIQYLMQSKDTDMTTKLRMILIDLLVSGYTYYRVIPSQAKNNIVIEVLDPRNTFIEKNPNSPYVKNSQRAVVRKYMSVPAIIAQYGNQLSKEDKEKIKQNIEYKASSNYKKAVVDSTIYISHSDNEEENDLFENGTYTNINSKLVPVYDVEWLETDSEDKMHRYTTTRIGDEVFILQEKDYNTFRSINCPNMCSLSINGVYYLNRSNQPYSLVLKCAHLQD